MVSSSGPDANLTPLTAPVLTRNLSSTGAHMNLAFLMAPVLTHGDLYWCLSEADTTHGNSTDF